MENKWGGFVSMEKKAFRIFLAKLLMLNWKNNDCCIEFLKLNGTTIFLFHR